MRPAILALLLLLGGTATAHAVPPVREVARTWDGAVLFVRLESSEYRFFVLDGPIHAPYMRRAVARLDPRTLRGVIVHLHDCSYRPRDMDVRTQARFMASLGYAVVVPDSFRRLYRPATCDAARHVALPAAPHLEVLRMRRAELAHAIGRVRALPWARGLQIYVSGYGEGGEAVLAYADRRILGRIAIGASCWLGTGPEPAAPTLIITARDDLWYGPETWPQAYRLCRRRLGSIPAFELLEPRGMLHNALIYWESQVALWNFLVRVAY